jgi:hypothetical protein
VDDVKVDDVKADDVKVDDAEPVEPTSEVPVEKDSLFATFCAGIGSLVLVIVS